MQCPVCHTQRWVTVDLENNLKAASCETCGGHWISKQNYENWLNQHGETLPEKPYSDVEFDLKDIQAAKLCPDCGRILRKYKVGHGLDFFIDHCSCCGGIWLDKNEWNALQDKNLHDEIHKVFSTSWQNQIRQEESASKMEQFYSNRMGAESYEKAKSFRQWVQDHPQRGVILAFVADEDPYKI